MNTNEAARQVKKARDDASNKEKERVRKLKEKEAAEAAKEAEAARQKAAEAAKRKAAEARQKEEQAKAAAAKREEEEQARALEAKRREEARAAEAKKKEQEARALEAKRKVEEERVAEAKKKEEEARLAEEEEKKRKAEEEEKRKAEEEQEAEAERKQEEARAAAEAAAAVKIQSQVRMKAVANRKKIYYENEKLFFKQYSTDSTTYEIYYKALGDFNKDSEYTNIIKKKEMNESFNYLIYKKEDNILIKPIKKYYTLKDILKQIYDSHDNIIIVSKDKDIGEKTNNILYQYKYYNKINLIFIYNDKDNNNNDDIDELIDAKNNYEQNIISQEDYNNIKEVIIN
jgi:hypothetical protein